MKPEVVTNDDIYDS